ncbi:MAG TPA: glycosyltransferase family 2 protein [Bacteroidales bacterium]|nr:glycosyltransferase family 2 protein [Bacteroidales bacterium]
MSISVVILTLNEEKNLRRCIEALSWCDDIIVFDSYSTDSTKEIALKYKTRFFQRKFDNYANQRKAAIHDINHKHPWILMVDADEIYDDTFANEMKNKIQTNSDVSIYYYRRKDYFLGKWLKRSSGYPTWTGRLFLKNEIIIKREINEEYSSRGKKGYLDGHFKHYPFNNGFHHWFHKHNVYSTMEAEKIFNEREKIVLKNFFSKHPDQRRKVIKQIYYRLPLRPLLAFFYLYIFRLGLIDGFAGFFYCLLRASYEFMIHLKVLEIERRKVGLGI